MAEMKKQNRKSCTQKPFNIHGRYLVFRTPVDFRGKLA